MPCPKATAETSELVSDRIGELRAQEEALKAAQSKIGDPGQEEEEEPMKRLTELPDLTERLRTASTQIKR